VVNPAVSGWRVPTAPPLFRPAEAGAAVAAGAASGQVWRIDARGVPQPVTVGLGVSDDSHTEVTGGGLAEGDEIVVGALVGQKS
jgi:hypothetical protein